MVSIRFAIENEVDKACQDLLLMLKAVRIAHACGTAVMGTLLVFIMTIYRSASLICSHQTFLTDVLCLNRYMTNTRMINIIKNLPSKDFTKEDKKMALLEFAKSNNVNAVTKCELQNAIIYLLDMVDFNKQDWNGI